MRAPTLHRTPRLPHVLREQVGAVGLALRAPALAAAALLGLAALLISVDLQRTGNAIDFTPHLSMLPGLGGLLFPFGVWMGQERFGASFLWRLPVDRRRHALTRVGAGWVWLMAAVAVYVLWHLALTLLSGGNIAGEETRRILPVPAPRPLDPSAIPTIRWTPPPLLWLVPFTAATGTYLVASALALGARHPLRWAVAAVPSVYLVISIADATSSGWLLDALPRALRTLLTGPYGLDALLTARTESLTATATLSTGDTVVVWRALPSLGQWATATLLWTGAGLLALYAAALRHRERRRT